MNNYLPDYTILTVDSESKEYEYNYFYSLVYQPKNYTNLCSHKGVSQLNIRSYSSRYFNYPKIKNKEVEIYYIVDNNYYNETLGEEDFNEELVDMIYGIAIVVFFEDSDMIGLELLCKNGNQNIQFLNYKPGEEILKSIFTKYENNKIIIIEPLNDAISKYYCNYKKPLIKLYNETGTFLYYGTPNTLKNLSFNDLEYLFFSFSSIVYFKNLFNYDDNTLNQLLLNNMDIIKEEFRHKLDDMLSQPEYNDTQKKEIKDSFNFRLEQLTYRNVDEILEASDKSYSGGRHKSRQYNKITKKKKNKKRLSKKRIIKK